MSTEPLITPLPIDGEEMKFVPPVAENLEDLGVPASMVEQLILKILYFRGTRPAESWPVRWESTSASSR